MSMCVGFTIYDLNLNCSLIVQSLAMSGMSWQPRDPLANDMQPPLAFLSVWVSPSLPVLPGQVTPRLSTDLQQSREKERQAGAELRQAQVLSIYGLSHLVFSEPCYIIARLSVIAMSVSSIHHVTKFLSGIG